MKILDAGDHPLSNADVLDWIRRKRAQHTLEDNTTKETSPNVPVPRRPENFLRVLQRTERELTAPNRYPYAQNTSVYSGDDVQRRKVFLEFSDALEREVLDYAEEQWQKERQSHEANGEQEGGNTGGLGENGVNGHSSTHVNGNGTTLAQSRAVLDRQLETLQESKCLTEVELLMLYNHAPSCVDLLPPMLENCQERFSAEEQQIIIDVISRILRRDENANQGENMEVE